MNLTASDRSALIRLASTLPKGDENRRAILAGLQRVAGAHSSQQAMNKYLKEHPGADKSKHWVGSSEGHKQKSEEHYSKARALRESGDTVGADLHQNAAALHSGASRSWGSLARTKKRRGEDHPETHAAKKSVDDYSSDANAASEKAHSHSAT